MMPSSMSNIQRQALWQKKKQDCTSKSVAVAITLVYFAIWQMARKMATTLTMMLEAKMAKIILLCLLGSLTLQSKRSGRTINIVSAKKSAEYGCEF